MVSGARDSHAFGIRVEEIDRVGRAVRTSDGDWTSYDKLILATGSSPEIPAIDGLDQPGFLFLGRWTIRES